MSIFSNKNRGLYEQAMLHANLPMLLIRPDNSNIVEANEAAVEFYGYPRQALLKMKINDINVLSEQEIKEEMRNALMAQRNHFNFRHITGKGLVYQVQVFSSPFTYEHESYLVSVIVPEKVINI